MCKDNLLIDMKYFLMITIKIYENDSNINGI